MIIRSRRILLPLAAAAASFVVFGPALGADPRTKVVDATQVPYRFVGPLFRENAALPGTWRSLATGALIGPRHVLTGAHVLIKPGNQQDPVPTDMYFAPGHHGPLGDPSPYGRARVDGVYAWREYKEQVRGGQGSLASLVYDVAVLHLDTDLSAATGGFFDIAALEGSDLKTHARSVHVTGYDSDVQPPGYSTLYQFDRIGSISVRHTDLLGNLLAPDTKYFVASWPAHGGASGSPVWVLVERRPTIIAVYGIQRGVGPILNRYGKVLSPFFVDGIKSYISTNP